MPGSTETLTIYGSANVVHRSKNEGIAAMAGTLKGGAYARVTNDRRDVGNGRFGFDIEHFFIHEDGSTIPTRNKSFVREAAGEITR